MYTYAMSASAIKIIALLLMLVDHIGMFFFPKIFLFRIIGRVSFPLFAWTIANGAHHTKNIRHYFYRLLVFSIISQIPYMFAIRQLDPQFSGLNIFFTLTLGLAAIIAIQRSKNRIYWLLISFIISAIAQLIGSDYGAYGVLVILFFYFFYHDRKKMFIAQFLLMSSVSLFSFYYANALGTFRFMGIFSVLLLLLYNNKRGMNLQYLFYVVYPLQFVVFYLMSILLQ